MYQFSKASSIERVGNMKKDYFEIHSKRVEEYLSGKREKLIIYTNNSTAKKLEKKYNILLVLCHIVNRQYGIKKFCVIKPKRRNIY